MYSENGLQGGVRERGNGRNAEEIWGAKHSLRRNAGLDKIATTEATPLLGSGSGSESGSSQADNEERTETEWAGHADFEGLTWWHKPSVSIPTVVPEFKLISADVLAAGPVLSLHTGHRRDTGPETQPDSTTRMPGVLY
jgi:hypothetical protein